LSLSLIECVNHFEPQFLKSFRKPNFELSYSKQKNINLKYSKKSFNKNKFSQKLFTSLKLISKLQFIYILFKKHLTLTIFDLNKRKLFSTKT
jgi:hypothetical protein